MRLTPKTANCIPPMKGRQICLFTAHSPLGGGGGAILRSLCAGLKDDFAISWHYFAEQACAGYPAGWLGSGIMGSRNALADTLGAARLLAGTRSRTLHQTVEALSRIDCDAYWVVSHNEGLRVAYELAKLKQKPVHLTVHDDWAGALCARSRRYRLLGKLADRLSDRTIKAVQSVDVVSEGMREYYLRRTGIKSAVVHRCLPSQALPAVVEEPSALLVGHVGSVYSRDDFLVFVEALKSYCEARRLAGKVRLWGSHLRPTDLPASLASWVELRPAADERDVVAALQQCRFVYAMYPFSPALGCFVRTSLPTKLSSYVMAGRPILGHAPFHSTLTTFLNETKLGVAWQDLDLQNGRQAIAGVLAGRVDDAAWENARNQYFGEQNLSTMRATLGAMTAATA